jgi:hypothetical protein
VRLARGEAEATPEDVDAIVQRMASAPFNGRPVRVPRLDRGLVYGDIVIGRIADPLDVHLAKRVRQEMQWVDGTTAEEYLADLRTAARLPHARLLVYQRGSDLVAAAIVRTVEAVPIEHLGPRWLPNLIVVHSARHGTLLTGYMFSDMSELDLPEEIRWLR